MPLVDLVTDLKSLKYGKDTPGGGYSGQPYIQAKIPDGLEPKSPDFILRGGYLTVGDSLTDIKRLTKMFFDLKSPNGLFFIAKQNVLSNSAVRTQTSGVLNEGIYTPLNTLAQAGVIAFGGHLNKQGINPFALSGAYAPNEYLYYNKINKDNLDWINSGGATSLDNRLFALYESRILNNEIGGYAKPNNINVNLKNTILTYRGGPGSTLGVGQTDIRFEDNGNKRTGVNNVQLLNLGFYGERKALPIPGSPFSINVIETPKNPSAGNYKVFKRINDRTTSLFISPYGVSNAYESATNELLPQGPNGLGSISINGGYTFDLSFYNNVYNTGSLTPYDPVVNSQKILKSVDISNKQVGGLQISTINKPWIKSDLYDLPLNRASINLNPSASLSKIPNGSLTWTPNFIEGINYTSDGRDFSRYLPTLSSPKINNNGVSGKYLRLTGISGEEFKELYNSEGQLLKNFNVYDPAVEGNTWPKTTERINDQYTYTYNQQNIIDTELNDGKLIGRPKLQDFRKILRNKLPLQAGDAGAQNAKRTGATPETPDYDSNKAYENRVNIGSKNSLGPGNSTNKNLVSYTAGSGIGPVDLINALSIYRSQTVKTPSEAPVNDLVKFRIAAIDNNNPEFKTFMHFRAFIDSFNDSYNASWGDVRYLGRGEKFYNYNGFDRTITLSFTVAAQSKQELIPMYKKLNYLASNLAPDYSPFGYMWGPLVQLTVGGYLYEQVGFITALAYDIPNDSPWEIGINDAGDSDPSVKELPHRINISSFSFTPIHNFVPQKQGLGFNSLGLNDSSDGATGFVTRYGQQRYIALTAGGDSNYDDYTGAIFTEREEEPEIGESISLDEFILREGL